MSTYITRFADSGSGVPVAVKDLIDMTGVVTTAGCRALADHAAPAQRDAPLLREVRRREGASGVWSVGKTNLHELAYGTAGANPWWGTSVNPRYPTLYPGGSSSGSATAVAAGEALVALGSDTGGSVRIPAACCGIAGLKTTWGRVPLTGVCPRGRSLDPVGPMAADVGGLVLGMQLLEPGFATGDASGITIGRVRVDVEVNPLVDAAVDRALREFGAPVTDVELPMWRTAWEAADVVLSAEAWRADGPLLAEHPDGIGAMTAERIVGGESVDTQTEAAARRTQLAWQHELQNELTDGDVRALRGLCGAA